MGYFVSFAVEGSSEPVDADQIATNTGYVAFLEWAQDLPERDYPQLCYLGWYAETGTRGRIVQLASDLTRAVKEKPGEPPEPVLGVARALLAVVRDRPEGAVALVVTDGSEGGDDEEEDE